MHKTIWSTLLALFLFAGSVTAEDQPQLPIPEEGYAWQQMPIICASGDTIVQGLTERGFVPVNMSLGRKGSTPDGEPVFLVTYFLHQDGTGTAATVNIPTSQDTCLMFVTHDLVINNQ